MNAKARLAAMQAGQTSFEEQKVPTISVPAQAVADESFDDLLGGGVVDKGGYKSKKKKKKKT